MREAERIYFLGFGYHPDNVRNLQQALGRSFDEPSQRVLGSCHGMLAAEKVAASRAGIQLVDPKWTCRPFLREFALFS